MKCKSKEKYAPFKLIYIQKMKKPFNFNFNKMHFYDTTIFFDKKNDEFNSSYIFEHSGTKFDNYNFLLLKIESDYDLTDFNIDYNIIKPNNSTNKALQYALIGISIFFMISLIIFVIIFCRKKNANSNLITNTSDNNTNLLPQ